MFNKTRRGFGAGGKFAMHVPKREGRVHVVIQSERMEFSLGGGKSKRGKEGEQTIEAALSC